MDSLYIVPQVGNNYTVFLQNDERMKREVLSVRYDKNGNPLIECRIIGFHEFMSEVANKFITETPLHLGYLGGFQE